MSDISDEAIAKALNAYYDRDDDATIDQHLNRYVGYMRTALEAAEPLMRDDPQVAALRTLYVKERFINGHLREVLWEEARDNGGMFNSTVGVYMVEGGRFASFVYDVGSGVASPPHATVEAAIADIERLWERLYG